MWCGNDGRRCFYCCGMSFIEHHSHSCCNSYALLSSPSTSPITLLAKSTRLPWRHIPYKRITFISLIIYKVSKHFKHWRMPISTNHSLLLFYRIRIREDSRVFAHTIFSINGLKNVLIRIKSIKIYKYGESYVFAHFPLPSISLYHKKKCSSII